MVVGKLVIGRKYSQLQTKFASIDCQYPTRIPYAKNSKLDEKNKQSFTKKWIILVQIT